MKKYFFGFVAIAFFFSILVCTRSTKPCSIGIAASFDDVLISYESCGNGSVSLVFVHGWSCDSRYWREQIPFFKEKYKVVTVDLAGHGHSGTSRVHYKMKSFGHDVKAVVDAIKAEKVILIGHSMGGAVIAEAARFMPNRVIGLVGVDTLMNVGHPLTDEELDKMVEPFENDFQTHTRSFVREMFVSGSDPGLIQWIEQDLSAAPSHIGISAFREYLGQYVTGEAASVFEAIKVPVHCVNADLWPTNVETNRRHMKSYDVSIMKNVSHFLMLEKPDEFNKLLGETIERILSSQ